MDLPKIHFSRECFIKFGPWPLAKWLISYTMAIVIITNCTVCGVKLNTKNRVSYRPNSCRDCELERKRLYSLKRKSDQNKRAKANGKAKPKAKPAPKLKSKAKSVKTSKKLVAKKTSKKPVKKLDTKAIAAKNKEKERLAKEREKLRIQKEKERIRLQKERERERILREKERIRLQKERDKERIQKEKEREKLRKEKEKEKLLKLKAKEQEKLDKVKQKEQLKLSKEAEREEKRRAKEEEREGKKREKEEAKRKKQEEKDKRAQEKAEKERKKKLLDMNIITDIPDYIVSSSTVKVKKRRLGKPSKALKNSQIIQAPSSGGSTLNPEKVVAPFNPAAEDTGEILRAPSDTPWEGSNFKIVGGSFVSNTENEEDENKGPSEDEVKAIIERIRLEHKTRKD